jgi:hypothetical protein
MLIWEFVTTEEQAIATCISYAEIWPELNFFYQLYQGIKNNV